MISLVYAVSQNGVIGDNGGLPWRVPSDLLHFKAVTMAKPIIMGRKTWVSLPSKPLPGRRNIVLTRHADFHADGAERANDVAEALRLAQGAQEVCVIGGAEVFQLFLPKAERIYLTRILADLAGDTFMPELDAAEWVETQHSPVQRGISDSAAFQTQVFERR